MEFSFSKECGCFYPLADWHRPACGSGKTVSVFSDNNFTSLQEEYLKTIITYVSDHDDISPETLVNESPFDEFEWIDVFGTDFVKVRNYVQQLHNSIVIA